MGEIIETKEPKIIKITKPNNWYKSYVGQTFNVDREQFTTRCNGAWQYTHMWQYRVLYYDRDDHTYKYGWVDACDCEVMIIPNNELKECDHIHTVTLNNDGFGKVEWCKKCGAYKRTMFIANNKTESKWIKPNPKRNVEDVLRDLTSACKECVFINACEDCPNIKKYKKEIEALNGK